MRITRIAAYQVDLPLHEGTYAWSGGKSVSVFDSTIVRLETDAGVVGHGEVCPLGPAYLPAYAAGVRAGLRELAPGLLGRDPTEIAALNHHMDRALKGHPYVKSPIDMACWDILGQQAGLPLWKLFGGEAAHPVLVNSSISTGTPDEMLALINKAAAKGYTVHSAKVGGSGIGLDIERIEAISAGLPKGHKVTFDVNRAWTPGVAVQVLNSVKARDWVEQPCETLDQCAHVAARVRNPIMLDECMHAMQDHLDAWKLGACEGVKVKPNRVGGLTRARQIRDFGVSVGWQMHIEDLGGSALADTAAIHLASSTPEANRLASWLCHYHLSVDPVPGQGARNEHGSATPPSTPGLGVTPDLNILGEPEAIYQ